MGGLVSCNVAHTIEHDTFWTELHKATMFKGLPQCMDCMDFTMAFFPQVALCPPYKARRLNKRRAAMKA